MADIIFQQIQKVRGRFLMEDCTLGVYNALGGEIIDSGYLPYDKEFDCHPIIRHKVWVMRKLLRRYCIDCCVRRNLRVVVAKMGREKSTMGRRRRMLQEALIIWVEVKQMPILNRL